MHFTSWLQILSMKRHNRSWEQRTVKNALDFFVCPLLVKIKSWRMFFGTHLNQRIRALKRKTVYDTYMIPFVLLWVQFKITNALRWFSLCQCFCLSVSYPIWLMLCLFWTCCATKASIRQCLVLIPCNKFQYIPPQQKVNHSLPSRTRPMERCIWHWALMYSCQNLKSTWVSGLKYDTILWGKIHLHFFKV